MNLSPSNATDIASDDAAGIDAGLTIRVRKTLNQLRRELLDQREPQGHWTGRLAASALSTATAVSAMSAVILDRQARSLPPHPEQPTLLARIHGGVRYLESQQNDDGGFGDTDRSYSNIATSYLVLAATTLAKQVTDSQSGEDPKSADSWLPNEQLHRYIESSGGIQALRQRYGKDKTFVVPILCNLAIAGLVPWSQVARLPFEAAVFPQSMYRWLQMPVVSYAIPALVAIGQTRHFLGPKALPPLRWIRAAAVNRSMRVLRRMQPESGGYLEATPLTAFVLMNLSVTGRSDCEVAESSLRFLFNSADADDAWPIDTNLATWLTSLSMIALTCDPGDDGQWCNEDLLEWHLGCQHHVRHPFTGAEPGGWGWSDLSGAVPDADDTPAAMLALIAVRDRMSTTRRSKVDCQLSAAAVWLLDLQNRNGGWPTFCRGWGKLPFDRSSNDLTAHAIRALTAYLRVKPDVSRATMQRVDRAVAKGLRFLSKQQRDDGSWLPLWFGNQDQLDDENPFYGTSRVLMISGSIDSGAGGNTSAPVASRLSAGAKSLIACQNDDGGWGGGDSLDRWMRQREPQVSMPPEPQISSVEETALVVEALIQNFGSRAGLQGQPSGRGGGGEAESRFGAVTDGLSRQTQPGDPSDETRPELEAIIRGVEFLLAG
ncbi:MAG: prenyltransferase/squalene oxidase repeat-containing protein, partial [Planctomycetota bacterium]